ncbi:MAG: PKD domain-containing protein [Bacteroidetes bacterium]|nr:PKD domain-containing protein [Bacteroidota bacterium]
MKHNSWFIILFSIIISGNASATTRRVLFLGNSYIFTNNLPSLIQQMATSMGDTLIYDENNIGGYTMQAHSTDATSISKIYAQPWDIVILQEQSQRPAFDPAQVATDTYPYARKLDSLVRDQRACTETMFFMTWGYKNGDASNCAAYPPICTYAGMQQRLRESYLQMAQDNNAIVSPVGAVWKIARDSFPSIDLYSADESHPNINGSYLAAAVFYTAIFHKKPINSSYTAGLSTTDAQNLRRIAGNIVLDSFTKWNQYGNYTYANFNKSLAGNTVTLTNTSVYATAYYWTFGDGGNSTATNTNHSYTANGKYYINLTASNTCYSETRKDSVTIGATSISNLVSSASIDVYAIGNGKMRINNRHNSETLQIEIVDLTGKSIYKTTVAAGNTIDESFIPGLYLYRIWDGNHALPANKIFVY